MSSPSSPGSAASNPYVELAFTVPETASEAWAEALIEAGASGVEERDQSTLQAPTAGTATLVVWVAPDEAELYLSRARVAAAASELPPAEIARRDRHEDEWRDAWKRHFSVRQVGSFVLVPSWEKYTPQPGEIPIDLDPGRAFGTGGHASTRLCLRALSDLLDGSGKAQLPRPPRTVLDVGCGSGVLAIAVARALPELTGVGVDVDPDAIEVAKENADINGVAERLQFSTAKLGELEQPFDLVLANIQPEVLIPLATQIAAALAEGGLAILSGILVEAAPPVEDAYRATGMAVLRRIDEDGWRALVVGRSDLNAIPHRH